MLTRRHSLSSLDDSLMGVSDVPPKRVGAVGEMAIGCGRKSQC